VILCYKRINNTSKALYSTYVLRCLVFEILVAVKWGNNLPSSAVTMIKRVVMCAREAKWIARLIFDRMITDDTNCDMLVKLCVSNIRAGANKRL
jgi:hypothetical protein